MGTIGNVRSAACRSRAPQNYPRTHPDSVPPVNVTGPANRSPHPCHSDSKHPAKTTPPHNPQGASPHDRTPPALGRRLNPELNARDGTGFASRRRVSPPKMKPNRRILLADDDLEVRLGVAELLSGIGLEVLQAESGSEAVELGRAHAIHAALLDMHMPGYTGMEALPLLQEGRAGLPCILYSGRWTPDLERAVLEAGAFACLKKPVEPNVLRREVQRALTLDADRPWTPEDGN